MNRGQRCVVWLGTLPMSRVHCLWTGCTGYEQGALPMSRGFGTNAGPASLLTSFQCDHHVLLCWPAECLTSCVWYQVNDFTAADICSHQWLCTVSSLGTFRVKWPVSPMTMRHQLIGNFLCWVTCHSSDRAPSACWELSVSSDMSIQWPCTISWLGTFCVKCHVNLVTMHHQLVGNFPCQVTCHSSAWLLAECMKWRSDNSMWLMFWMKMQQLCNSQG